jgi:hypothetical protein
LAGGGYERAAVRDEDDRGAAAGHGVGVIEQRDQGCEGGLARSTPDLGEVWGADRCRVVDGIGHVVMIPRRAAGSSA